MGFNLNTRNTNNLRGSKEIDSIGDDLINISSSLGSADVSRTFAFISLNDDKPETNDNLDNLIYSFNNNSISVNNWISLRSFVNKILSSYPG